MAGQQLGVVAAGHPRSAQAGADVLRAGGNAVDAALGAILTSCVCEPMLTGLGAGGYMLVTHPSQPPVLLDFFVEAPGRGADPSARAELIPVDVSFGDAIQVFNIGAASVGTYGVAAGICEASRRFGRMRLTELAAPAAQLARTGVELNAQQAYVVQILDGVATATPEAAALFAPEGRLLGEGDPVRQPELADAIERLAAEGSEPFYRGEVAAAIAAWVTDRGGMLTRADLAAYQVIERDPIHVGYRGHEVLTNPPPSAGGILIARALQLLSASPAQPSVQRLVAVMERVQGERTADFLEGLGDPGFAARFLGSTTHIAVLDAEGWACSVTCSNGSCSGVIVPGTGLHLNNMMGEQDLNPLGFHRYPPGRRMPSMMAPTTVLREGAPRLVLGSAGSNRIRSAILQTIVRVIDDGLPVPDAVEAPRAHFEDGVVYVEPGMETGELEQAGATLARFRALNLFFGGVQAVERDPSGRLRGAGDPRRGGAAVVVET